DPQNVELLRFAPLVRMPSRGVAHPFNVHGRVRADFLGPFDCSCLRGFHGAGALRTGAPYCVVALITALDENILRHITLRRHQYSSRFSAEYTMGRLKLLKNGCHGSGAMKCIRPLESVQTGTTVPAKPAARARICNSARTCC